MCISLGGMHNIRIYRHKYLRLKGSQAITSRTKNIDRENESQVQYLSKEQEAVTDMLLAMRI